MRLGAYLRAPSLIPVRMSVLPVAMTGVASSTQKYAGQPIIAL